MKSLTEYIMEAIYNTPIIEMAIQKSEFMHKIDNLTQQIIENYILVRYCTLKGGLDEPRAHWAGELRAHMTNILKTNISSSKENAIRQQLIDRGECNNLDYVDAIIYDKLEVEKQITDQNIIKQAINDFCYNKEIGIERLIKLMAQKFSATTQKDIINFCYNEL